MDKEDILKTARKIVDQKPDPIINFLLRTRILGDSVPQNMLRVSSWYARLKKEQERNRRSEDGYWDFGKPANITNEVLFPLSENWRKRNTRKHDYTTHVLL